MAPKFRLDIDTLAVDSFETVMASASDGTVFAHGCSDSTCNRDICDCTYGGWMNGTCDVSCQEPCQPSFAGCESTTTSGDPTTGPLQTRDLTCATGSQDICYCGG